MKFSTLAQLTEICKDEKKQISEVMLEEQAAETGHSTHYEFQKMAEYYQIMKQAVKKGLTEDTTSRSGLTGMDAQRVMTFLATNESSLGAEACVKLWLAL